MLEIFVEHLPFTGHTPLGGGLLFLGVGLVLCYLVELLLFLEDSGL